MTRVFIADNHQVTVEGIKAVLSKYEDLELVGDANCTHEILEKVKALRPDIVIMEAFMPYSDVPETILQINGVETAFQIKQIDPKIRVIIFTSHPAGGIIRPLLDAGISAYVLKHERPSDLYRAIINANGGQSYFSKGVQVHLSGCRGKIGTEFPSFPALRSNLSH
jgi:DNA-binding NarL/FixJ family response regulator